ncbi:hypothetical protein GGS20DRAFT_599422 [Poronia punctata]|nr:hypothetical protein GGS20DRAFT_599422 [Poronia punctata]
MASAATPVRAAAPSQTPIFPTDDPRYQVAYAGRDGYLLYLMCQKRLVTWLVRAAAEKGEAIDMHQEVVPFNKLLCLSEAACRGKVPEEVLEALDVVLDLLASFCPNWLCPTPVGNDTRETHPLFRAREVLWAVGRRLKETTVVPRQRDTRLSSDTSWLKMYSPHLPITLYSLPPLPHEAFFAWNCFFCWLGHLRRYLRKLWLGYMQSSESLIVASLMTDSILRVIRRGCDRLLEATRSLPGMPAEDDVVSWYFSCHMSAPFIPEEAKPGYRSDLERSSCSHGRYILGQLNSWLVTPDSYKRLKRAWRRWPRTQAPVPTSTIVSFLMHLLFPLEIHSKTHLGRSEQDSGSWEDNICGDKVPLDPLTAGYTEWRRCSPESDTKFPLWLSVVFQVIVDIKETLSHDSHMCRNELLEAVEQCKTFSRSYPHHAALKRRMMKASFDPTPPPATICPALWSARHWYRPDELCQEIGSRSRSQDAPLQVDGEHRSPLDFFENDNPTYCGLRMFWMRYRCHVAHQDSILEHEDSIIPAALLYLSMRLRGLVGQWNDMEYALKHIYVLTGLAELKPGDDDAFIKARITSAFKWILDLHAEYGHSEVDSQMAIDSCDGKDGYLPSCNSEASCETSRVNDEEAPAPSVNPDDEEAPDLLAEIDDILVYVRSLEEELGFDWLAFHDRCELFFECFRQSYDSGYDELARGGPLPGTDEHTLDALYYLLSANDQEVFHMENLILALMCTVPEAMDSLRIPFTEYCVERWGSNMRSYLEALGISLESAAGVFGPLIERYGQLGCTMAEASARALRTRRKTACDSLGTTKLRDQATQNDSESDRPSQNNELTARMDTGDVEDDLSDGSLTGFQKSIKVDLKTAFFGRFTPEVGKGI